MRLKKMNRAHNTAEDLTSAKIFGIVIKWEQKSKKMDENCYVFSYDCHNFHEKIVFYLYCYNLVT